MYSGMVDCITKIIRTEGSAALYKGAHCFPLAVRGTLIAR
jgi:hypothetical protein